MVDVYKKVYYLNLECIAVWDDFPAIGAFEEELAWQERKGPFGNKKDAKNAWTIFRDEVEGVNRYDLRKKYGVNNLTKVTGLLEAKTYTPSDFYFQHKIKGKFEKIKK